MALLYYPQPGEILLCDYSTGFIAPEMVKRRPVVVVSPRLRRRPDLVAVVPLSTLEPQPIEDHQCRINLAIPLPKPFDSPVMWAKCDMLATVSRTRLDRFKGKRVGAQRIYLSGKMTADQLKAVRSAMLCGLGLSSLTIHL
jgi:mRNA interferase MazF